MALPVLGWRCLLSCRQVPALRAPGQVACGWRAITQAKAVETAPAIAGFGIPEATTGSADHLPLTKQGLLPETVPEAVKLLQQRAQGGPLTDASEVQELVGRSLGLAREAQLQDIADLAEAFVALRLRLPLRDVVSPVILHVRGRPGPEALHDVLRIIRATGQGSLFYNELFEFCFEHVEAMQARDLALLVYEAGRHGLRCRHLLSNSVQHVAMQASNFSLDEVMWAWQGYIKFSKDFRRFYQAVLPNVRRQLRAMSTTQLLLALRAARDLRLSPGFPEMQADACTQLMEQLPSLTLSQAARCLLLTGHTRKCKAQVNALVRAIANHWSQVEDLSELGVVEVVDALDCFASWWMQPTELLRRLDAILVEREVELKYTGNVMLWGSATRSLADMKCREAKWPLQALELSRDKMFVDKISFFQQCVLMESFAKLGLFDAAAYRNLTELLLAEANLFKEIKDVAPVAWAAASMGFLHKELLDALYIRVLEMFEAENLDMSKRDTNIALTQAAWSFAVAGYHRQYESFSSFLDYVFWNSSAPAGAQRFRAELAELCITEAPDVVSLCQCPDQVAAAVADAPSRTAHEQAAVSTFRSDVASALQELGWSHCLGEALGDTGVFRLDLVLSSDTTDKIGLLLAAGPMQITTLEHEPEARAVHGSLAAAARAITRRGWKVALLSEDEWRRALAPEERAKLLHALVERACESNADVRGERS